MLSVNPFAVAGASLPAGFLQGFLVVMALAVVVGTIFDMVHKGSARYFFANMRKLKGKGRAIGGGELVSIAVQTAVVDVLASGEFCNPKRRVAHLLGMYGFVLYLVATAVMVFGYPTGATSTPAIWPMLWWIGALMVLVGGYWFWFFIRVDVAAEGNSPFRLVRADLFVVALVFSVTFGLVWAIVQTAGGSAWAYLFLALYLIATTVLFGSIPWSKFAHMFFKPAAALEKRILEAIGTRSNLPAPADAPRKYGSVLRHSRHY